MVKSYIVTLLLLLSLYSFGQPVDSLEQTLIGLRMPEQLKAYDEWAQHYAENDVNLSLYLSKRGLILAQNDKNEKMIASFHKNMGVAYYRAGTHDTAIIYLGKARTIADKLQLHELQASIYNAYGNIYLVQNQYDRALGHYFAAVKILEKYGDTGELIKRYFNIGGAYQTMKNFEQALKYLKMAEKLALQTNNQEGLAYIYVSLSDISVSQGKPKAVSVDYARKAVAIFKKIGNKRAGNIAMQALAQAYFHHGDYSAAEPIARQAVIQAKAVGNPDLLTEALTTLSGLDFRQGQYAQSIERAMEVLAIDTTDNYITMNAYATLAKANAYLGHPELTEKYLAGYQHVMNQYANASYQNSISGMEVKYETEKKQLKIDALEQQHRLYVWLGITGILILLTGLAFAFMRYRLAVSRRKLAEETMQRLEQEKQLVAVQATLDGEAAERTRLAKDLHDGLGSMLSAVKINLPQVKGNAVLEAVDVSRFQKAIGMLDDSIQELRRVAHHMMPESLVRYGLKVSLSDFCAAIPIADFHYFGKEAPLPDKLEIMVYRCVHELVNNVLKHAEATQINVQLIQEDDRLSFTVQDNGKGFDQQTVTEGMGLRNIRQRVAAFQGKIEMYSSGEGTEIHVELELWGSNKRLKR